MIWQAVQAGLDYFQREVGYTRVNGGYLPVPNAPYCTRHVLRSTPTLKPKIARGVTPGEHDRHHRRRVQHREGGRKEASTR